MLPDWVRLGSQPKFYAAARWEPCWIAVRTPITGRPPHRNRTCGLPAYGSHLGCLTAGLAAFRTRSGTCTRFPGTVSGTCGRQRRPVSPFTACASFCPPKPGRRPRDVISDNARGTESLQTCMGVFLSSGFLVCCRFFVGSGKGRSSSRRLRSGSRSARKVSRDRNASAA